MRLKIFFVVLSFAMSGFAFAGTASAVAEKPLALVYSGPGACGNCWISASQVTQKAGFKVLLVNEKFHDFSKFKIAKLWVQPGGKSKTAAAAMGEEYLNQIRQFVFNGGGYVGFCAGGFLSTAKIGTSDADGLGIMEARTKLWDQSDGAARMLSLNWNGNIRSVYYHGGPYFTITGSNPHTHAFAFYDDGKIAAVSSTFGQGRVAVTGAHPEASKFWKLTKLKHDSDGSDQDLAIQMIQWATELAQQAI